MSPTSSTRRAARAALFALGAALVPAPGAAAAPPAHTPSLPPGAAGVPLRALERAFWICDYVASTRGFDATPIGTCQALTEAFRRRKFGDDLDRLVAWWREHRVQEYARLRALDAGS